MISELRDQYMGQQPGSGKTTLDRTGWRRRFNDAVTPAAGELRPYMANDLKALGDVLQLLGDIFTELAQVAPAIGAAVAVRKVSDNFAWKMFWKWLAPRARLRLISRRYPFHRGSHLSLRGFQLFQVELKLFELKNNLLALGAEHHASQL